MSNLFKKFETDPQREDQGVELTVDDCVFICRRAGGTNRRYRVAMGVGITDEKLSARLKSDDPAVVLGAEDEISIAAFADAVVIGWKNVLDRNDQPWEFSRENFIDLMTACPDVWLVLRMAARDADNFRLTTIKETGEALGKS